MRWPSDTFRDWLMYVEWWGIEGMDNFGYVIIDDMTGENVNKVTNKDCFKGEYVLLDQPMGGLYTKPIAFVLVLASIISSIF